MNLIERYIYAFKKHLPRKFRDASARVLRNKIQEMLTEEYTDADVLQVLNKLGDPRKLAEEYNPDKKYLIGPTHYETYLSIITNIVIIYASVSFFLASLEWISQSLYDMRQFLMVGRNLLDLIFFTIQRTFEGAAWGTIAFIVLIKLGVEMGPIPFKTKKWTPAALPIITTAEQRVSPSKAIFRLVIVVIVAITFCHPTFMLGIFIQAGDGYTKILPFKFSIYSIYSRLIMILALLELTLFVWKFIVEYWNKALAIFNGIINLLVSILVFMLLTHKDLINYYVIREISRWFWVTEETVTVSVTAIKWIIGIFIIGIYILSGILAYLKATDKKS